MGPEGNRVSGRRSTLRHGQGCAPISMLAAHLVAALLLQPLLAPLLRDALGHCGWQRRRGWLEKKLC